jgi:sRNA-binding carbon storage regulator CsrA
VAIHREEVARRIQESRQDLEAIPLGAATPS